LVIVCVLCCVVTAVLLWADIQLALRRQQLALDGDPVAAKHIILPCYKPLIRGILLFNILLAVSLSLTFLKHYTQHSLVTYFCVLLQNIYLITPVMLMQTSVSRKAFLTTAYSLVPYWVLCSLLCNLTIELRDPTARLATQVVFIVVVALCPSLLAIGILTKRISSRIQVGSNSNRNSTELLLVFSLCFGACYVAGIAAPNEVDLLDAVLTSLAFCLNQIFPFALYRTLLADTKFWRGLGKHNRSGMDRDDLLRQSGVNVHRPTMELHVVNSTFQDMMSDIDDLTVDFAYLKLARLVGEGATAKVFLGTFKRRPVAIKVSTPPEITEEVMDVFVAEAKVAAAVKHKNIVEFIGICIRPPQIGMVFEFCAGGDLKSHLCTHRAVWTARQRIRACLDASCGVMAVHALRFIHRDIKTENFFVSHGTGSSGKDSSLVVKLGDFGETIARRNEESTAEHRMTIVGTVAYMAPELVVGERYYDEKVDVYALGVTCWEIWTGEEPYAGMSTFDIYDHVKAGQRLPLPTLTTTTTTTADEDEGVPEGFNDLLEGTWSADPAERLTAAEMVTRLRAILRDSFGEAMDDDSGVNTGSSSSGSVENQERSSFSFNPLFRRPTLSSQSLSLMTATTTTTVVVTNTSRHGIAADSKTPPPVEVELTEMTSNITTGNNNNTSNDYNNSSNEDTDCPC
jgi:serine/threonine protein kinase